MFTLYTHFLRFINEYKEIKNKNVREFHFMLKRFLLLIMTGMFVLQCEVPTPKDIIPPVPILVYPYTGAVVSSNTQIRIDATDNDKVEKVWAYLDGVYVGQSTKRPYLVNMDLTPELKDGLEHVIRVAAEDDEGNIGYSAPVTFFIAETNDIIDPTVSIINPQGGQQVEGNVNVVAVANDERSIQKVKFFVDGVEAAEDMQFPYSYNWDTSIFPDSSFHTVYAEAFDGGNNSTVSAPVTVQILPRVGTAATILTLYPIGGSTVSGTVSVVADIQFQGTIKKAELYIDGNLKITDTNAADGWKFNWNTAGEADGGQHSIFIKAYDTNDKLVGSSALTVVTVPTP